jgi:Tat protein secretion system quality control protein TatD with DNase activity
LNITEEFLSNARERMIKWHQFNDTSAENNPFYGKHHDEKTKEHLSAKRKEFYANGGKHPKGMLGKKHNDKTKEHVSLVLKEKSSMIGKKGLDHPCGGTKWYNNGVKHVRSNVHPGEGWNEGRIFKERKKK